MGRGQRMPRGRDHPPAGVSWAFLKLSLQGLAFRSCRGPSCDPLSAKAGISLHQREPQGTGGEEILNFLWIRLLEVRLGDIKVNFLKGVFFRALYRPLLGTRSLCRTETKCEMVRYLSLTLSLKA